MTTSAASTRAQHSRRFASEPAGLPDATSTQTVELFDGDTFDLEMTSVKKRIGDATVRMLAYNGSVPGPTLRVRQGSTIAVRVTNRGDLATTVHWHGLRLDNRYDGTHMTQEPIPVGGTFIYELQFPDAGAYWYHPHVREDYGQELGLYGSIIVAPEEADYWPPVHREIAITLDDVLIEDGRIAAFNEDETNYVAMGRFGNRMLVAGESDLALQAKRGEVVRFYLTNTANTRVFNVALPGARMKVVGSDSGHNEREAFVETVLLAPSERVVVDVLFDSSGEIALEHRTPDRTYGLARISVSSEAAEPPLAEEFGKLRTNADIVAERDRIARYVGAPPDKTLAFVAEMDLGASDGASVYMCPMHPDVVSNEPGKCPKCLMKLVPKNVVAGQSHEHEHGHGTDHGAVHTHSEHGHATHEDAPHSPQATPGLEWEDDMVEVNRITTTANMRWKLIDRGTAAENAAIDWSFSVGDQVKIRLVNDLESDHPMPHPFHIHGAGRFLVLSRDGLAESNLAWKDTVLVRTGETVDILFDVTHPGVWMAHCHIAEHHESGMMFTFTVNEN